MQPLKASAVTAASLSSTNSRRWQGAAGRNSRGLMSQLSSQPRISLIVSANFPSTRETWDGRPLTDIKRTWLTVCREAGLAERAPKRTRNGKVFHGKDGQL